MSSSRAERLRLLLDTTYLLPIVGVDGVEPVLEALARLYNGGLLEAYYTPFNLLELVGKVSKLRYDPEVVEKGLTLIHEKLAALEPGVEAYMLALRLRARGFPDLIDLLLYATAATRNVKLLTRDDKLLRFLEEAGEDTSCVIHEKVFLEEYAGRA